MSPLTPAAGRLRLVTWNLNSLRARLPGVEAFVERTRPDVLCLQETKTDHLLDSEVALFDSLGYVVTNTGAGAYNGVAVVTTAPPVSATRSGEFGVEALDREPRVVTCVIEQPEPLRVASVYVPHGRAVGHWHYSYKLAFLDALARQVTGWLKEGTSVVVAGDVNVAATDSDVFHPEPFAGKVHVTTEERSALTRLLDAGPVDVEVARWGPRARRFTWWSLGHGYDRNLGMRIDVIAADAALAARLDTTWIDHAGRSGERPSDHAALLADFRPLAHTVTRQRR